MSKESQNSLGLLKAAILEFFRKLMPCIIDPEGIVQDRWRQLRELLLDDKKTVAEIYDFVKRLSMAPNIVKNQQIAHPLHPESSAKGELIKGPTLPSAKTALNLGTPNKLAQSPPTPDLKLEKTPSIHHNFLIFHQLSQPCRRKIKKKKSLSRVILLITIISLSDSSVKRVLQLSAQKKKPSKNIQLYVLRDLRYSTKAFNSITRALVQVYSRSFKITSPPDTPKKRSPKVYVFKLNPKKIDVQSLISRDDNKNEEDKKPEEEQKTEGDQQADGDDKPKTDKAKTDNQEKPTVEGKEVPLKKEVEQKT